MAALKLQVGKEIAQSTAKECGVSLDGFILKSGKVRVSYYNIPTDGGWVDCKFFMPINYDIVHVRTVNGKECPAWWSDSKWEGLRLRKGDRIIKWKFSYRRDG